MLPMQVFIDFLLTHQVFGIPMIRYVKHLGDVPQNGHRFSQDHTIMFNKWQLKENLNLKQESERKSFELQFQKDLIL